MSDKYKKTESRLLHLDMLRVLAIFLVIFNHTGDRGYFLFADRMETALYFPYMLVSICCKVAVPIFFMISGALLLPKEEPLRVLFSRRILRMVTVLLVISVPYYYWLHRIEGLGISSFLIYIYANSASTSLWYLYSYLSLLLMLPFLRRMVKVMEKKDFLYLFSGYIVLTGVVPCLEYLLWKGQVNFHESFSPVLFSSQNIFYALMGYYLEHIADDKKLDKRGTALIILINVLVFCSTAFMTHYQTVAEGECDATQLEQFFNCFICIPAMSIYCILKMKGQQIKNGKARKVLMVLGEAVFGVYLIEKFGRALTDPIYIVLCPYMGSFAASLIWCMTVLLVSLLIILALKRIPVLKNMVNKFI